jgi:hypothetical protein
MANHTPYLQRRGDAFSFRIAVPSDLLPIIGKWEFTKSLQTTDKHIAVPTALQLAAAAKQLFNRLNKTMSDSDESRLTELLRALITTAQITGEKSLKSSFISRKINFFQHHPCNSYWCLRMLKPIF